MNQSDTSLDVFSFDLSTLLLIPYLSGFGQYDYKGYEVSLSNNVVVTFPPVPMDPRGLVIQARSENTSVANLDIVLNDSRIGSIMLQSNSVRRYFPLKKYEWSRDFNILKIVQKKSGGSVDIENIWLLEHPVDNILELAPGNHFVGITWFPEKDRWGNALLIARDATLRIPVRLPAKNARLSAELFPDSSYGVRLLLELVSAKKFGRKESLVSEVRFMDIEEWTPIYWDISEQNGNHALLRLTNQGESDLLLRHVSVENAEAI